MRISPTGTPTSPNPVRVRGGRRTPWGTVRGIGQLKKNLRELAKTGDQSVINEGFNRIGEAMKLEMNSILIRNLTPPTEKYIKSKKGKALWLRTRGIVAKPFRSPGKSKSFVGIDYRYGPHAHWFEFGTGERLTEAGKELGKIPGKNSKIRLRYFRPVVNDWTRSGRFVNEVKRVVQTALQNKTSGLVT